MHGLIKNNIVNMCVDMGGGVGGWSFEVFF